MTSNVPYFMCIFLISDGILDFDLSSSNSGIMCDDDRMLVSACADGSVLLWHLKTGKELRRLTCSKQMQPQQHFINSGDVKKDTQIMRITGVRFLPKNNNLYACATSGGLIRLLNVSTGKFLLEGSGHTTGKPSCIEIDPRTGSSHQSLLWSGSDRGYIESFR
jgi:WD40 repeat protein